MGPSSRKASADREKFEDQRVKAQKHRRSQLLVESCTGKSRQIEACGVCEYLFRYDFVGIFVGLCEVV